MFKFKLNDKGEFVYKVRTANFGDLAKWVRSYDGKEGTICIPHDEGYKSLKEFLGDEATEHNFTKEDYFKVLENLAEWINNRNKNEKNN